MTEHFSFEGFTLRTAGLDDLALADMWTAEDPDHAGRVDPMFWIEQEPWPGYLLSDREGALFFFKGVLKGDGRLEVHIQFPPYQRGPSGLERYTLKTRLTDGLTEGMRWLENRVRGVIKEVYFESVNSKLIYFCERRLGFSLDGGVLRKRLDPQATGDLARKGI